MRKTWASLLPQTITIILSRGDYVAFLDCDDAIVPDGLEKVAAFIKNNPDKPFIYTDRINIDPEGEAIENVTFKNRSTDAFNELLIGMYTSHLKTIKRDCFLTTWLLASRFDSAQDYDISLRMSENFKFGYINEYLYKHRVHEQQTTLSGLEKQNRLAERIKQEAIMRRALYQGNGDKLTSVVMLTLNRLEDTQRSIDALYAHTKLSIQS